VLRQTHPAVSSLLVISDCSCTCGNYGQADEASFCSDGKDNDCDGDTDGADSDCAGGGTDYTPRSCNIDGSASPTNVTCGDPLDKNEDSTDATADFCLDGTSNGVTYMENIFVNSTIVDHTDTVQVTCEVCCYTDTNTEYAILYNSGSGWINLDYGNCINGSNPCKSENKTVNVNIDDVSGTHYFRCWASYSVCSASDMCCSSTYGDNDDMSIAVIGSAGANCGGGDTSCGIFPDCDNCNFQDGCSGNDFRDYFCSGSSCDFTADVCADCSCTCGDYGLGSEVGFCADGKDNDCGGGTDCADSDCYGYLGCCSNSGQDGDETGIDCGGSCVLGSEAGACADGIDNDKDCLPDCLDPDCSTEPACTGATTILFDDFEANFAAPGWYDDGILYAWSRDSGGTGSTSTGPCGGVSSCPTPAGAANTVYYIYVETSGVCNLAGDTSIVYSSPEINFNAYTGEEIRWWNNMYGSNIGTLSLQENTTGSWVEKWTMSGAQGTDWFQSTVDLSDLTGTGNLRFNYTCAGGLRGDIAIDQIGIYDGGGGGGELTTILFDDFESDFVSPGWYDDGIVEKWTQLSGGTSSSNTGPTTGADGTTKYIYVETSSAECYTIGETAIAYQTPEINFNSYTGEEISWWNSMYGTEIGTLILQENTTGTWVDKWIMSGDQGTAWFQSNVDLSGLTGTGNLRFHYTCAGGFAGDAAIDEINITGIT